MKLSHYQPETQNSARIALQDFDGYSNERVFWSSRESGCASYVLVRAHVTPATLKDAYFLAPDGTPVLLVSVNGCGETRWVAWATTRDQADLEAIAYWNLSRAGGAK